MLHKRTGAFHTRGFNDVMLVHPKDKHIFSAIVTPSSLSPGIEAHSRSTDSRN